MLMPGEDKNGPGARAQSPSGSRDEERYDRTLTKWRERNGKTAAWTTENATKRKTGVAEMESCKKCRCRD